MTILNQSIRIMQNYAIWIQTVLLLILKAKIFMKILQMMLKKDLIHQIMNAIPLIAIDHYLQEKNKKVIGLMKDELGGGGGDYGRICSTWTKNVFILNG